MVIVSTASRPKSGLHAALTAAIPTTITLKAAANPIFLVPAARSAETGEGAPVYVSGAHRWNGTAAILKPKPPARKTSASTTPESLGETDARRREIVGMSTLPVIP